MVGLFHHLKLGVDVVDMVKDLSFWCAWECGGAELMGSVVGCDEVEEVDSDVFVARGKFLPGVCGFYAGGDHLVPEFVD